MAIPTHLSNAKMTMLRGIAPLRCQAARPTKGPFPPSHLHFNIGPFEDLTRSGLNVERFHQPKDRGGLVDGKLGAIELGAVEAEAEAVAREADAGSSVPRITYSHLSATIGSTRVARRAGR